MYQQEPRKGRKEEVVLISARLLRTTKSAYTTLGTINATLRWDKRTANNCDVYCNQRKLEKGRSCCIILCFPFQLGQMGIIPVKQIEIVQLLAVHTVSKRLNI